MNLMNAVRLLFAISVSALLTIGSFFLPLAAQDTGSTRMIPTFVVDPSWPRPLPNDWIMGAPSMVAVDRHDHVWVIHRPRVVSANERDKKVAPAVVEFDNAGQFVNAWGGPGAGYDWPDTEHGIFVDFRDHVWITGNNPRARPVHESITGTTGSTRVDDMILKFTTKGQFLLQIGGRDVSGGNKDTANPHQPADVFVPVGGQEAYVADGYGNTRVWVIDANTGAHKRMWGAFGNTPADVSTSASDSNGSSSDTEGEGPDQFTGVLHSVKVSNDGLVYAADRRNRRIQVFTQEGKYLKQAFINRTTSKLGCAAVAFSPDPQQEFIYCPDYDRGEIIIIDRQTLRPLRALAGSGSAPGQLHSPHSLAVDSHGNIYVAEVSGRRIQKFTYTGMTRQGAKP